MNVTQVLETATAGPTLPAGKAAVSDRPSLRDIDTLVLARPAGPGRPEEHECVSRVREALKRASRLMGNLSVCESCARIGDDLGHWEEAQWPVVAGWSSTFRRTICGSCFQRFVRPEVDLVYAYLRRAG